MTFIALLFEMLLVEDKKRTLISCPLYLLMNIKFLTLVKYSLLDSVARK